MNGVYFNPKCLSNENILLSQTLSPKKHRQVIFDKIGYQYKVLVSITATSPNITTATHIWGETYSLLCSNRKCFATKLCSSFGVTYWKFMMLE